MSNFNYYCTNGKTKMECKFGVENQNTMRIKPHKNDSGNSGFWIVCKDGYEPKGDGSCVAKQFKCLGNVPSRAVRIDNQTLTADTQVTLTSGSFVYYQVSAGIAKIDIGNTAIYGKNFVACTYRCPA